MKRIIYLDNASTTPVRPEVISAMKPYWTENFGNPGSITKIGVKAQRAVENSRKIIAECLKARPQEIIFTSGGTESNNLAIFGVANFCLHHLGSPTRHSSLEKAESNKISNLHFVTTNIEHSSITECFKELERRGAKVDYLKVSEKGMVNPKDLRKMIKPNTVLISVGYANNEIGTIQPIKEIAKEIRHFRKNNHSPLKANAGESYPLFHTDASQAGLYCNLNVNELGVDLLTVDAQKIYGPKGVGILFVKAGVKISPIIFGGGQERGLRSGTENVPLIVGMAKSLELARGIITMRSHSYNPTNFKRIKIIRDYFWHKIQKEISEAILNGDLENRLPNNLNISIPGIDSEFMVLCLDEAGIICSTKSACNHDEDGSFVVRALGRSDALAKSSLRFSLGEDISKKDIDYVVSVLSHFVRRSKQSLF